MTAHHLVAAIADRRQEVVVGVQDRAVHGELDHRLGLVDGGDLALEVGGGQLLVGDVDGVFHHLERGAARVEDRVVAGLNPDLATVPAHPPVLTGVVFAAPQLVPEGAIGAGLNLGGIDEHGVMAPDDLIQPIADRGQEVAVGVLDRAVHAELDHRLGLAERLQHAGVLAQFGDVVPLQHIADVVAAGVQHRHDPERKAQVADADLGDVRAGQRLGQHGALVRGVLVEDVDGGPHHPVQRHPGEGAGEGRLIDLQQGPRRVVQVDDGQIAVHHHQGGGGGADHRTGEGVRVRPDNQVVQLFSGGGARHGRLLDGALRPRRPGRTG
ncbi:hypothetical protein D3C85_816510 [compost metagenome]